MELTRSLVEREAQEYCETEPLFAVEQEHVEMLPGMFADGEYGWRDAEWVVQWYFRRHLGAYPDRERRAVEEAFGENAFEDVLEAVAAVAETADLEERLDRLTALSGVDVPVASAYLQFMYPDRYVTLGEREWGVLNAAGELDGDYPEDPSPAAYLAYHDACRAVAERTDVDAWTLYRALWRLAADSPDDAVGRPGGGPGHETL